MPRSNEIKVEGNGNITIQDVSGSTITINANEEFQSALSHFRKASYKETLNDCLKTFESTMKIICTENGWKYKETDTAKKLISICMEKGLLLKNLDSNYSSLLNLLESGIPTIRNKKGGHGQGPKKIVVDEKLASYMIDLTASTVKYLIGNSKK